MTVLTDTYGNAYQASDAAGVASSATFDGVSPTPSPKEGETEGLQMFGLRPVSATTDWITIAT